MKLTVRKEIGIIIEGEELDCSVKEFKDKVNWSNISYSQKLSEKFIREFKDKVDWISISHSQKLSGKFIREFKDKVCWIRIFQYQQLSEKFIREFKDKVNWLYISCYQQLSEKFIYEFKDKLNTPRLVERNLITQNKLEELEREDNELKISRNISYRFEILDL